MFCLIPGQNNFRFLPSLLHSYSAEKKQEFFKSQALFSINQYINRQFEEVSRLKDLNLKLDKTKLSSCFEPL